jgi:hypothetical protein
MKCKDCDAEIVGNEGNTEAEYRLLVRFGWRWIDLVEPPDTCNGWRCPNCVLGWEIIVHEHPDPRMLH